MRFKLTFSCAPRQLLPLNYQYELASWIYKAINRSDAAFASWLHSQGYHVGSKSFKLFNFSNLHLPPYRLQQDRLLLQGNSLSVQLSFALSPSAEHFIKGVFQNQQISIGDSKSRVAMEVQQIEALPPTLFRTGEPVRLRALSPICISTSREQRGRQMPLYHSPADEGYKVLLLQNLLQKYIAAHPYQAQQPLQLGNTSDIRFRLLTEPKSRLITIKANTPQETKVRGFLFDFELTGPEALLQLGYTAGFGEKNSLGFGYVEVVE